MERIITFNFVNTSGDWITDDAIVEFVRYDEDGLIVNEVLNVFLPNYIDPYAHKHYKAEVTKRFHNGEGYNL